MIVLITKTATQNQGNQALSIAWRDFLAERFPESKVRLVERAPGYLKRYTTQHFARSRNPVEAFDTACLRLISRRPDSWSSDPSVWEVRHDPAQQQVLRFLRVRQLLRLRSRLAGLRVGAAAYHQRLSYVTSADLVVVNPAGEFLPSATDTALHYLMETRCAQLGGAATAFVNVSLEVTDLTIRQLAHHVLGHCDVVEVRDEESRDRLVEDGLRSEPFVCADGAIMTRLHREEPLEREGIAVAINGLQVIDGGLLPAWDEVVAELRALGPVRFTSNEWSTDHGVWSRYLDQDGVESVGETLDYAAYAAMLARHRVVVSSRLHTCVLGMVAGAPVVPVETGTFKLTGFFRMVGLEEKVIAMGDPDWQALLPKAVLQVMESPKRHVAAQDQALRQARRHWLDTMTRAFEPTTDDGRSDS